MKIKGKFFKAILFILILGSVATMVWGNTRDELQERRRGIQEEMNTARAYLDSLTEEMDEITLEVLRIDIALDEVSNRYFQASNDLEITTQLLNQAEIDLENAEARREVQQEALVSRLQFIHENNNFTFLELLLASSNFNEFLTTMEHISTIVYHDNNLFANLLETENAIANYVSEISFRQAATEILLLDLEAEEIALYQLLDEKETLMALLEQDYETHLEGYRILEESSREINRLIQAQEAEAQRLLEIQRLQAQGNATNTGDMLWPVQGPRGVTSHFGYRTHPVFGGRAFHSGVDLRARHGTNILAAESGVVTNSGWMRGYGNTVIIYHGGGISTLYSHNSANLVRVGESVARGQVIARAGATGIATGPHLHFEVRVNGRPVNPRPYLGY